MSEENEHVEKEVDSMNATVEYNEKTFLAELEESLKEVHEKRKARNSKSTQSSWHDLFNKDKE